MGHVDACCKWHLQYLIPDVHRSVHHVHGKTAGVFGKLFKRQELQLYTKSRMLHFKCPYDFLVRDKRMDNPICGKYYLSLRICRLKSIATMLFIFKL